MRLCTGLGHDCVGRDFYLEPLSIKADWTSSRCELGLGAMELILAARIPRIVPLCPPLSPGVWPV